MFLASHTANYSQVKGSNGDQLEDKSAPTSPPM